MVLDLSFDKILAEIFAFKVKLSFISAATVYLFDSDSNCILFDVDLGDFLCL